jgi:two-component system copper resistance phosphate regulon response regulator CusR
VRVLVVEDDADLARTVRRFLVADGFAVDVANDLPDADFRITINAYDVLVLDRMLPSGDSVELLRAARAAGLACPVLLLTARDSVADRIEGLQAGADDYLVKPFAMGELVARVQALARRVDRGPAPGLLVLADLQLDPARQEAARAGHPLALTPKELCILRYLLIHAGRVVSQAELVEHCWDEFADPASNVVEVKVGHLRRKLGQPPLVHTVRGAGYLAEDRIGAGADRVGEDSDRTITR